MAYEREPLSICNFADGDTAESFLVIEIRMTQLRSKYLGFSSQNVQLGYSRLHVFKKTQTVRDLRLRIYEIVRPLLKYSVPLTSREQLENEHDSLFKKSDGKYRVDNPYYDIEIHNNLPDATPGIFYNIKAKCDFCQSDHKDNCMLAFEDNVTIEDVLAVMVHSRNLDLTIAWKPNAKAHLDRWESPVYDKVNLNAPTQFDKKRAAMSDTNIDD